MIPRFLMVDRTSYIIFLFQNDRVVSLEELDEFIDKSLSKKLHIYRKEDVKNYLVSFL